MRLLFITQDFPPGIGGIQTYSAEHAIRLSKLCEDFLLICPENRESGADDSIYEFDVKRVNVRNTLLFLSLFRFLPGLLEKRPFDASFHAQWQTVWPALRARKRGLIKKIYVAAHARELLYNPYRNIPGLGWLYRKKREYLFKHVDHFFPVSGYTAGILKDQGVDPDKITVVVNGTDPGLFRPFDASDLKKELQVDGTRVLLTVTRLVKRKGIDTMLHAFANLGREFDDLSYVVIGTGPEEERLKRLARHLGITSRVRFPGKIQYHDLPQYYNMADLFVLSSRTELPDVEGFGIVFLEANACEKPVIGTNSGGVPSAIEEGKTGLIVRENDPDELAEAIRTVFRDPEMAASMGKYGRQRVLRETNWDTLSSTLFRHLSEHTGVESGLAGKRTKRVLMIAPYFLPRRRVGSLRPFRFAIHLKESGWEPHVVTLKSDGVFTDLEKKLIKGVVIHEIHPGLDMTSGSGSQLNIGKKNDPARSGKPGFGRNLAALVDKHFPMDTWLILFFKELKRIREIAVRSDADVIWSTGDPWSSHWLANRLSEDLKLPWIADFRDPWTLGGVQLRSRSGFSESMDRKYERQFMKNADFLTFTSGSTEELYRNYYPEIHGRTATITNSFDSSLMRYPGKQGTTEVPDQQGLYKFDPQYLNIVFFGKFRGLSPAEPVAEVLKTVGRKAPKTLKKIRVYSFGELGESDALYAKTMGVFDNFIAADPVPPEMGPAILGKFDILLLSTDPRREHIIPAKLWDYLVADRPILSLAPNPEIADILKSTGAGIQLALSEKEKIADFLINSIKAKEAGDGSLGFPQKDGKGIEAFSAEETTRQLADLLDQLSKKTPEKM